MRIQASLKGRSNWSRNKHPSEIGNKLLSVRFVNGEIVLDVTGRVSRGTHYGLNLSARYFRLGLGRSKISSRCSGAKLGPIKSVKLDKLVNRSNRLITISASNVHASSLSSFTQSASSRVPRNLLCSWTILWSLTRQMLVNKWCCGTGDLGIARVNARDACCLSFVGIASSIAEYSSEGNASRDGMK